MDSKLVNAELRQQIRPLLKEAGFTTFTDRTSWRYAADRIDVVNFQSFNAYLAEGIGSTTYSFCVNLGCAFTRLPPRAEFKVRRGRPAPLEYECDVRRTLKKSIRQPEVPRPDVWYIDERGSCLEPAVADASRAIESHAFSWFDRFADYGELLRTLLEDREDENDTWGFGNQPSPLRAFMIGYTARALGRLDLARDNLAWLVARESTLVTDQVRSDLAALSRGTS